MLNEIAERRQYLAAMEGQEMLSALMDRLIIVTAVTNGSWTKTNNQASKQPNKQANKQKNKTETGRLIDTFVLQLKEMPLRWKQMAGKSSIPGDLSL